MDAAERILGGEASLGTSIEEVTLPEPGGALTLDELEASPELERLDDRRDDHRQRRPCTPRRWRVRQPFITGRGVLRERIEHHEQGARGERRAGADAALHGVVPRPPAHLVGVPFEYLVPDARLLEPETIRFFYLDRSWLDRLCDGALAVGKAGTREQAHHHTGAAALQATLDQTERVVRPLQRQRMSFQEAKEETAGDQRPAEIVMTGSILRSGAVSGWPHMDVRAGTENTQLNRPRRQARSTDAAHRAARASVLIALFEGIPTSVWSRSRITAFSSASAPTTTRRCG